jgi:peptidoglycan/LPS O-acetylase OafA/YrhL
MNLGSRFAHGQVQFDLLFVSGFAVSIAAAWLMYRWVEVPAKNLAKLIRYESAKPVPAPNFAMRQS